MSTDRKKADSNSLTTTDLGELMSVMDVVDLVRRGDKGVRQQLSIDEERAQLKQKLKETYAQMGTAVEDTQLDRAVENYYSKKWEFKAPTDSLSTKLATTYINREAITKRIILPALAWITAGVIAVKGVEYGMGAYNSGLERGVESAVKTAFEQTREINSSAILVANSSFVEQLPAEETQNFRNELDRSKTKLNETNPFFEIYCPSGDAVKAIDQKNYEVAEKDLNPVKEKISSAKTSLENARNYLVRQEQYNETGKSLENLISSVKIISPAKPLLAKAEKLYEQGRQSILNRQLEEAKNATRGLSQVAVDCKDYNHLVQQSAQLYNSAEQIAEEEIAKQRISAIKRELDSYIQLADVASLRTSTSELKDINENLMREYTIEPVTQQGLRTGLWRKENDHPPRNNDDNDPEGKRFYIVSHAVNTRGEEVNVRKKNIEGGTIDNVTIWGEGVPHEVYLRIKGDKMDNGVLDNSNCGNLDNKYLGKKKKGYLSVTMLIKDNKGNYTRDMGQLTREENNWRRPSE